MGSLRHRHSALYPQSLHALCNVVGPLQPQAATPDFGPHNQIAQTQCMHSRQSTMLHGRSATCYQILCANPVERPLCHSVSFSSGDARMLIVNLLQPFTYPCFQHGRYQWELWCILHRTGPQLICKLHELLADLPADTISCTTLLTFKSSANPQGYLHSLM